MQSMYKWTNYYIGSRGGLLGVLIFFGGERKRAAGKREEFVCLSVYLFIPPPHELPPAAWVCSRRDRAREREREKYKIQGRLERNSVDAIFFFFSPRSRGVKVLRYLSFVNYLRTCKAAAAYRDILVHGIGSGFDQLCTNMRV